MKIKKSDIGIASKLFGKFDKDKNGLISTNEFKDGVNAKLGQVLENDAEAWIRAWKLIDWDNSK
jgi:Ca2+-binding EF-hand superfamily protein